MSCLPSSADVEFVKLCQRPCDRPTWRVCVRFKVQSELCDVSDFLAVSSMPSSVQMVRRLLRRLLRSLLRHVQLCQRLEFSVVVPLCSDVRNCEAHCIVGWCPWLKSRLRSRSQNRTCSQHKSADVSPAGLFFFFFFLNRSDKILDCFGQVERYFSSLSLNFFLH